MLEEEPIILLEGVCTAYEGADRPTLHDIDLAVMRGEFVVIGGPNGAGKTTLLETINGMLPITRGKAFVCSLNVRDDGVQVRTRVGYLVQNFAFDPLTPFTVEEVVLMGRFGRLGLFRKPGDEDYRAVERALRLLGIEDLAPRPMGRLSGGQQQKVLIAQNLAREPEVLLLDEPFSNLDIFAREAINSVLARLAEGGMTIAIVSHAFDDLPHKEVRLLLMQQGRIAFDTRCRPEEVPMLVRENGSACVHA